MSSDSLIDDVTLRAALAMLPDGQQWTGLASWERVVGPWVLGVARRATAREQPWVREDATSAAAARVVAVVRRDRGDLATGAIASPEAWAYTAATRAAQTFAEAELHRGIVGHHPAGEHRTRANAPIFADFQAVNPAPEKPDDVDAAALLVAWVRRELAVEPDMRLAAVAAYILARRRTSALSTLTRGRHRLGADPALQHYGYRPGETHFVARWFCGTRRTDGRGRPGLIDCMLDPVLLDRERARLRRDALSLGATSSEHGPAGGPRS